MSDLPETIASTIGYGGLSLILMTLVSTPVYFLVYPIEESALLGLATGVGTSLVVGLRYDLPRLLWGGGR